MSPSESELRAALRAGDGEGVDADAVITRARGARHARRMRLGSIAAAVIAVGGIAAGVVTLRGGGGAAHVPSTPPGAAVAAACPAQPPRYLLPGGGGTGQFGAAGPLFAKPVDRLLVCGYLSSRVLQSTTLTGTDAQQVADSLNQASSTPPLRLPACPPTPPTQLLLRAPDQPDVVAYIDCSQIADDHITNGTAIRYQWRPPRILRVLVDQTIRPTR